MDDGIFHLTADIRRERVARARRMSFGEKFLAGGELFDAACAVTAAGIRYEHPDYTAEQVAEELRDRFARRAAREYRHLRAAR